MVRKTILFVDDSSFLRKHLSTVLADSDYDVHSVDDGQQALDWIARHPPADLVITDLHMPNLDGIGLIGQLRAHRDYSRAPIFVMTSGARDDEKAQVRAAGATAWIVKPFDREKLVCAIERVVH
ncbi:MAG: response regulator [Sphingobium sp.]|nr:response regulator [Sphingobium sp.]